MSTERRYSLTRVCLSRGQICCTQSLASFFPVSGKLKAIDTVTGDTLALQSADSGNNQPRIILGLRDFYQQHSLQVNDTIFLKYAEEDTIHITPVRARRKMNFNDSAALKTVVDYVAKSPTPLSESDIHGLYPELPHNLDLNKLLKQDHRITKHEGRWQNAALRAALLKDTRLEVQQKAEVKAVAQEVVHEKQKVLVATAQARANTTASPESSNFEVPSAQLRAPNESLGHDMSARIEAFHKGTHTTKAQRHQNQATQGAQTLRESIAKGRPAFFGQNKQDTESNRNFGSATAEIASSISGLSTNNSANNSLSSVNAEIPEVQPLQAPEVQAHAVQAHAAQVEIPEVQVTGDYATLHKQAREKLEPLGFTVTSIEQGQLLLKADMGRDNYTVLMYLLPDSADLNWPSALAQRIRTEAKYLSILGNSNDLHKLDNSASFVRATRWSWQALDRVIEINEHMDMGPAVLEPCFHEAGLDTPQIEVFQSLLKQHLNEVGFFSQVVQSVANRKVPSIFVLDDIMADLQTSDLQISRDSVVSALKILSQVPFNFIEANSNHEFILSKNVSTGLTRLEKYCNSLKGNLPETTGVERFTAAVENSSD